MLLSSGFRGILMCISRTGTNLGPKALREAGDQFLLYNANTGMDLSEHFTFADVGDVPVVMGNAAVTMARAEAVITEVLASGAIPVTLGGDHSITIAGVRAFAKAVPACGLILMDTHFDTAVNVGGETRAIVAQSREPSMPDSIQRISSSLAPAVG